MPGDPPVMDPNRWQRVDALFEAALERAADQRPSFLDEACEDDVPLRREVESLLAAAGKAGRFLGASATGAQGIAEVDSIGPYRIEREIGHGGMGTVYLAVRADDAFQKRVAVKLLHPGLKSAGLVRRFRSERQILATFEHPNIARLLDGGATDDGRQYLVMEYIDGLPIDQYCDRHRLSVAERLEIFQPVCEAVHYAHRNLVVHRDVKPSNILVAAGPGTADGMPRLLDFGIAKLLDPEAFPHTVEATVTGQRPMTPSYASPEQIRGEPVTTASDVYSLGALLYQLLTGRRPHRLRGLTQRQAERALLEVEPVRPSVAVTRTQTRLDERGAEHELTLERVSRQRGARPQQLRRQLAGDLDNIVAKALRKDLAGRYGSVEPLLEDLRRHRQGLPVTARRGSFGYAVGKFLRRHRLAVGAGGVIVALILLFAAATARQAARERDRAERVAEFLIDLFEVVDPGEARGNSITAREVLDRGAERIEHELADQPVVQARLRDVIGNVYLNLGLYGEAETHLVAALATHRQELGPAHPDLARSLHNVAILHRHQGRYAAAEPLFRQALEVGERAWGPEHPEVAEILTQLAILQRIQGRYDETESLAQRARRIYERALGPEHPKVADVFRVLAGGHVESGEDEEAERLLLAALAIYRKNYGEDHVDVAVTLQNLGYIYWSRNDPAGAGSHQRRALRILERLLGMEHPMVADALTGIGLAAKVEGRYDEAERDLRRALTIYEGATGDDHIDYANCLYELGHLVFLRGRDAEAESILQRSLAIREDNLGPGHPWVAESLRGLADLRRRQGRLAEAEELYRRALAIQKRHPGHPGTAGIPQAYSALLRNLGRPDEAARLEAAE